ncbi:MAG: GNAT family N-acetyltransferase [Parasphingopyxis sp.]|uniref:GNAT family N-acetyltransferase n=1 Tax=Parasphingopyxis sp. TaxID=1920299 RepID=UPI003F9F1575
MLRIPAVIHGNGVCLRPHRPSDLPAFEAFVTDPEATRYMGFTAEQKTPDGAAAMMEAVIDSYATEEPVFSLTIADPDTDAYLGAAGAADSGNGTLEVFVTLLPEAQGRGHAADAMRALIDYLFGNFGIQRLNADTVEDNLASIRLLEGLGFSCAGPVERAAAEGEFGHRDMAGLRYVMTRDRFDTLETTR